MSAKKSNQSKEIKLGDNVMFHTNADQPDDVYMFGTVVHRNFDNLDTGKYYLFIAVPGGRVFVKLEIYVTKCQYQYL